MGAGYQWFALLCFALVCVGLGQVDLTQLRSKTTVTRHPQQSARH